MDLPTPSRRRGRDVAIPTSRGAATRIVRGDDGRGAATRIVRETNARRDDAGPPQVHTERYEKELEEIVNAEVARAFESIGDDKKKLLKNIMTRMANAKKFAACERRVGTHSRGVARARERTPVALLAPTEGPRRPPF